MPLQTELHHTAPKQAHRFTHHFQVELLQGSGWKAGDGERFLALCEELASRGDYLKDLVIGPADFTQATNTESLFANPVMQKILRHFDHITLSTSFANQDANRWAKRLNEFIPAHALLELDVLFDFKQRQSEHYLTALREQIDFFALAYKGNALLTLVMPEIESLNPELFSFAEKNSINLFNRHLVRSTDFTVDRDNFLKKFRALKKFVDDLSEDERFTNLNIPFAQREIPFNYYYSYRAGHWYFTPILYHYVTVFDPRFLIPTPKWTAEAFTVFQDELMTKQLSHLNGKPCDGCEYLGSCSSRLIPELMDALDVKECLAPQKAFARFREKAWLIRDQVNGFF